MTWARPVDPDGPQAFIRTGGSAGMERRNIIVIGVAVLLGLVAVYIVNSWFSGVEQRQEQIAKEQAMSRIAVARLDMPFGTPLTADNVRLVNWPSESVPAGAYT